MAEAAQINRMFFGDDEVIGAVVGLGFADGDAVKQCPRQHLCEMACAAHLYAPDISARVFTPQQFKTQQLVALFQRIERG